jgi:hypothetical protein
MKRVLLATCSILLLTSIARPQTTSDIESLKGLSGVTVLFSRYPEVLERNGITSSQIATEIELRLRRAGIKVLSPDEAISSPGSPVFAVNLNAIKSKESLYAISIHLELNQLVNLVRKPSVSTRCATWQVNNLVIVGENNLRQVKDAVGDGADIFANDFLTANPK